MKALKHQPDFAEALDRALTDRGPAAAVANRELRDLLQVAHTVATSAAELTPTAEFRVAARQRLLDGMARSSRVAPPMGMSVGDRVRLWGLRFAAGLTALGFAGAAAASASASALPGDPLYPVKQATEAVTLQLATTDSAREGVLLHQADTRLDETARLLEQGRSSDAAATAARYDDALGALSETSNSEVDEADLRANQARLSELVQTAPAPARAGLERALANTERKLDRSRPTGDAVPPEIVQAVVAATPEPSHTPPARAADANDRAVAQPRAQRPADAGERGRGVSQEAPPPQPGTEVEGPVETPPGDVENGPSPAVESHGSAVSEGHAAPHNNPRPAATQPGRTPPDRPTPPRSQPGGRGRP